MMVVGKSEWILGFGDASGRLLLLGQPLRHAKNNIRFTRFVARGTSNLEAIRR